MGDRLRGAVQRNAAAARALRPGDGKNTWTDPFSDSSLRNALDARPGGDVAGRQSRTGLLAHEARQNGAGATLFAHRSAATRSAGVWKLHLTPVPAGGSCPQQALPAIWKSGYV